MQLPRNLRSTAGYRLSTAVALLLGSAITVAAAAKDPCAAIAGKSIATFSEAKECLDHFPFNQTTAKQTLDTVRKVVNELYVFNVCPVKRLPSPDLKRASFLACRKLLLLHPRLRACLSCLSTFLRVSTLSNVKSGLLTVPSRTRLPLFWTRWKTHTWYDSEKFFMISLLNFFFNRSIRPSATASSSFGSPFSSTRWFATVVLSSTLPTSKTTSGPRHRLRGLAAR